MNVEFNKIVAFEADGPDDAITAFTHAVNSIKTMAEGAGASMNWWTMRVEVGDGGWESLSYTHSTYLELTVTVKGDIRRD